LSSINVALLSMQSTTADPQADTPEALYQTLATFFENHSSKVVELDVVPWILEPVQHDDTALAIRPRELAKIYLVVHRRLFPKLSLDAAAQAVVFDKNALLQATTVILLFAPEHLVAANARKRSLQAHIPSMVLDGADYDAAVSLLRNELCLLDSFVTSPLPKHTKSPNLWSHRLWVLQKFLDLRMRVAENVKADAVGDAEVEEIGLGEAKRWPPRLEDEIKVVLKAGDRHFANYVAFDYARRIYMVLGTEVESAAIVKSVLRWCFSHPRDISGWSFLDFLLRQDSVPLPLIEEVRGLSERFVHDTGLRNESIAWFARVRGWEAMQTASNW
jgi:hypothetical protein